MANNTETVTPDISEFNKACIAWTSYCERGLELMQVQERLMKAARNASHQGLHMLADAELTAKGLPTGPSP